MSRTIQLRRYRLVPTTSADFITWWSSRLVPARLQHGFAIEFGYRSVDSQEFVWAVSAEGGRERFLELERAYLSSPERAAAFEGAPEWTEATYIEFVEDVTRGGALGPAPL